LANTQSLTAICAVGIRHDRCRGTVHHLYADEPCGCTCHEPIPDADDELELAAEMVAELAVERELERAHGWWS
jgi:hypothetical protein